MFEHSCHRSIEKEKITPGKVVSLAKSIWLMEEEWRLNLGLNSDDVDKEDTTLHWVCRSIRCLDDVPTGSKMLLDKTRERKPWNDVFWVDQPLLMCLSRPPST